MSDGQDPADALVGNKHNSGYTDFSNQFLLDKWVFTSQPQWRLVLASNYNEQGFIHVLLFLYWLKEMQNKKNNTFANLQFWNNTIPILGKEKSFPETCYIPGWVCKLNWQRQTHRRKAYVLYWIFPCTWESSQENEDLKKRPEPEACLPFRQIINLWRTDKTKRFGLGVVIGWGLFTEFSGLVKICLHWNRQFISCL